jgi:hypothetical protein
MRGRENGFEPTTYAARNRTERETRTGEKQNLEQEMKADLRLSAHGRENWHESSWWTE